MRYNKILFFIVLTISAFIAKAQYDGELKFIGRNFLNNKPLVATKIRVTSQGKTITELDTKDNNSFNTKLDYGKVYDIYFINTRCHTMFIRVFADGVPEEKRYYKIAYALDIPFFAYNPELIDTSHFSGNPFHQIIFDGKSKFVDDTAYMNRFIKKIYTKRKPAVKKDTTAPILTTEKIKEYLQLAGKLSIDNDKKTPLKNKTVVLKNKKGEVISSAQTTNHGNFVFKGVASDEAQSLNLSVSSSENPNNDKIKLQNAAGEDLSSVNAGADQSYSFVNAKENEIIRKLINNEFKYNVAGKLIATNAAERKVASGKTVYLLNEKNSVLQKTKTNVLGTFLFSNVNPGQSYSIAYDSADTEPNYVMNLFTVKDKFVKKLDSVANHKFVYRFMSVAGSSFNDLVMDDSELRMNVTGKLYGNNKNNPLTDMKVLLLNEKYETIDSAITTKEGDFSFKHLPYNRQLLISADNEKNVLESFDNILVFDNADNLIKIVSQIKGQKFNYRPLPIEQTKLVEVYVDDPWLSVIEQDKTAKLNLPAATIIENILFEFAKADLQEQSKQTLDKVVLAMKSNLNFTIELSAHSDSKGGDAYNLKLSEQRANSSKNYIASKGISADRIVAKGYGETKLINNCGNGVTCTDDEHAVNRRLEFKLIFN